MGLGGPQLVSDHEAILWILKATGESTGGALNPVAQSLDLQGSEVSADPDPCTWQVTGVFVAGCTDADWH